MTLTIADAQRAERRIREWLDELHVRGCDARVLATQYDDNAHCVVRALVDLDGLVCLFDPMEHERRDCLHASTATAH